jgi:hypothetical protein
MTNKSIRLLLAALILVLGFYGVNHYVDHKSNPCLALLAACTKAGYKDDAAQSKSVFKDCVKPLMTGETLADVTADPEDIVSCKTTTKPQ